MKCIKVLSSSKDYPTKKYIFENKGKSVEASYVNRGNKNIVCVSCMFGCPVKCKFCASGKTYYGNLTSKNMISIVNSIIKKEVKNSNKILISFMGSGEPLLNLEEVLKSISYFHSKIANSHFAISVSGTKINNLSKLAEYSVQSKIPIKIQLSLHSPFDSERKTLIPTTSNIDEIFKMINKYKKVSNNPVELNYILLNKVNDSVKHAKALASLIKKYKFDIKINEYHNVGLGFTESQNKTNFIGILNKLSIFPELYSTDGQDINAACGQLVSQIRKSKVPK